MNPGSVYTFNLYTHTHTYVCVYLFFFNTGRRVLYCGENGPKEDEKRNTPSHVPDPKQGSEIKPVLMRAWEKLTGFLVALGTEQVSPGVGFCSFSTRN